MLRYILRHLSAGLHPLISAFNLKQKTISMKIVCSFQLLKQWQFFNTHGLKAPGALERIVPSVTSGKFTVDRNHQKCLLRLEFQIGLHQSTPRAGTFLGVKTLNRNWGLVHTFFFWKRSFFYAGQPFVHTQILRSLKPMGNEIFSEKSALLFADIQDNLYLLKQQQTIADRKVQ